MMRANQKQCGQESRPRHLETVWKYSSYTIYSICITVYRTVSPMVMVLVTEIGWKATHSRHKLFPLITMLNNFSRIDSRFKVRKHWKTSVIILRIFFLESSIKDIQRIRFRIATSKYLNYSNFYNLWIWKESFPCVYIKF